RVRSLAAHAVCCSCSCRRRALHSFPTRRSSDLGEEAILAILMDKMRLSCEAVENAFKGEVLSIHYAGSQIRIEVKVLDQVLTIVDRKSTRLNSSHVKISYAVFCLKKKMRRGERE